MTNEEVSQVVSESEQVSPSKPVPLKNPKRVAAGKKGVEARKLKAELKRKEAEQLKKENIEFKLAASSPLQITMDNENIEQPPSNEEVQRVNIYKNNIPTALLCIGVVGIGLYVYRKQSVQTLPVCPSKPKVAKEEIDPFEL